ncbi:cytosine-specific methyltransferase (plasmid) [Cylindrospermum sp. NIES-4074]|nr:cytosine-specific methyltransferase [Cylindrospermum sp. NIES-4074]
MLTHASLFTGIGGFELGIREAGANIKTGLLIENNPEAQQVLKRRFPGVALHSDIRDYQPTQGEFNVYTIGFPCTGTSNAGARSGLNHPESKMWFYALRCIAIGKPEFVVIEQPRGIINNGLREVLGGLRVVEYQWEDPEIVSAAQIGAPHERDRLFIIAHSYDVSKRIGKVPTGWNEQIRAEIEAIHKQRGQATPGRPWLADGVPKWLGRTNIGGHWRTTIDSSPIYPGIRKRTNKRRECIDLYGRSVTPQQAAIAIKRVCYLAQLAGIV